MGKITLRGLAPPDDPMFSGSPEAFSAPLVRPPSTTVAGAATAGSGADSQSSPEEPDAMPNDLMQQALSKAAIQGHRLPARRHGGVRRGR